jgi:hypothetical protein
MTTAAVAIRERPILFSGPMVRAILDGRKTQTRRVCKEGRNLSEFAHAVYPAAQSGWISWFGQGFGSPEGGAEFTRKMYQHGFPCPYGAPGDRLWVRETWSAPDACECSETCHVRQHVYYHANDDGYEGARFNRRRPSIHMPRWASRITLEITDVRVQRVQEISEADALAEGVTRDYLPPDSDNFHPPGSYGFVRHPGEVGTQATIYRTPQDAFHSLWNSLNEKRGYGWDQNPWVWTITFQRVV